MSNTMKKLIVFVIGLAEIMAGFAIYETSVFGAFVFVALGILFIAIMFLIDQRARNPYDSRYTN
ncbi:hypothetical protein ERX37_07755 [Macrococcus hajekii]|uniref:Uncharacterized protein n=1 Tax=Macrococcus hajekii TaxID=198482 RepID=A0A4R6BKD6_9STAP|nr:hypothetical protein [Macrococcus hajekii]TDM02086.1 hypothetical protein ERX37_07755 [Macrococcus hajekii]GGB09984.1 hypothetical protein GCM10007190_17560 [Macrococcus hajekii]